VLPARAGGPPKVVEPSRQGPCRIEKVQRSGRTMRWADQRSHGSGACEGGAVLAILYVFSVLFGLVIGSFLNVVIYRVPRHESLLRPGSHCPGCDAAIRWYDNIPLVSWIVLRGRCRSCKNRISIRYPLVEGFTGASFGLAAWRFGLDWPVLLAWFVIAIVLCLALIDLDHMILPSVITLPAAAIGLGASVALHPEKWWWYLASAAGAAAFCFILAIGWPGGAGMGGGDVTMALFVGSVLGFPAVLVGFFFAVLLGFLVGMYMLVVQKKSRKTQVPFGPFLSIGTYVAFFAGETILTGWLGLFS
jgi:leader peptidase (prepilin peptidase)/N-methyltransferase